MKIRQAKAEVFHAERLFAILQRRLKTDLLKTLKHQVIYDLHEDCNDKQRVRFKLCCKQRHEAPMKGASFPIILCWM